MKPPPKVRADLLVLARGLADSRTRAQALILAGDIVASGGGAGERRVDKPGDLLREDVELRVKGEGLRFVSRGGLKVERAIEEFKLDVAGARCLDLGASTGGFTDCLLQRGAASVVCVDVGRGQLHEKLRQDPRVESHEQMNARDLPESLGIFDVAVADVSFISLRIVLPSMAKRLRTGGVFIGLVKPQFECGRDFVEKGGVVRDPAAHARAVSDVESSLEGLGFDVLGHCVSPIEGPAGNIEFLVAARRRVG